MAVVIADADKNFVVIITLAHVHVSCHPVNVGVAAHHAGIFPQKDMTRDAA
jgi:hypothetical protein